jgi:hypothetical protein
VPGRPPAFLSPARPDAALVEILGAAALELELFDVAAARRRGL